jgi:hypothetical protein
MSYVVKSYSEIQRKFLRKTKVKQKRKEVEKLVIPKKPGRSNLLHNSEQALFSSVFGKIWEPCSYGRKDASSWYLELSKKGYANLRESVKRNI